MIRKSLRILIGVSVNHINHKQPGIQFGMPGFNKLYMAGVYYTSTVVNAGMSLNLSQPPSLDASVCMG
jgi:hypothetical protein